MLRIGPNVSRQSVDETARRLGLAMISAQPIRDCRRHDLSLPLAGADRSPRWCAPSKGRTSASPSRTTPTGCSRRSPSLPPRRRRNRPNMSSANCISKRRIRLRPGTTCLSRSSTSRSTRTSRSCRTIVEQYDAVGRVEKPHPHGTGMVGAIAAHQRLRGIAPGAKIFAIRAFSSGSRNRRRQPPETFFPASSGRPEKGARVINMSFAGPYDPMLQVALKNAREKGVVLVAASGNQGPKSPPLYPAADPNVIGVTATDETTSFSARPCAARMLRWQRRVST